MSSKVALVTGCDKRYTPLLLGFLESVRDAGTLEACDVIVFDIDFTESQIALLRQFDVRMRKTSDLPTIFSPADPLGRDVVVSYRTALPELFPGYEIYIYMDVDVWLQDAGAISILITAAGSRSLAIAFEFDRAYRFKESELAWTQRNYESIFGPARAQELMRYPPLNSGVFAMHADSPGWAIWREAYRRALDAGGHWFASGQAVLTDLHARRAIPIHPLPSVCNWTAHLALPAWDGRRRAFVTPFYPREKILVMHQTDDLKIRSVPIAVTNGRVVNAPLSYRTYKKLLARDD
ncbi:MAG: hypothetical protein IT561_18660 [Alphaproteobacteria bacterium]|nr:hypothetical protein [Alphaproteobacteria bacterium]